MQEGRLNRELVVPQGCKRDARGKNEQGFSAVPEGYKRDRREKNEQGISGTSRDTRGAEERRMNRELVVPAGMQEGQKREE